MVTPSLELQSSHRQNEDLLANAIVKGRAEGLTYEKIAEDLGVSYDVLYQVRQRIPFSKYVEGMIHKQLSDIEKLHSDGDLINAMAFRDRLIARILPREYKVQQTIEDTRPRLDLSGLSDDERAQLRELNAQIRLLLAKAQPKTP